MEHVLKIIVVYLIKVIMLNCPKLHQNASPVYKYKFENIIRFRVRVMVDNATFNNISITSLVLSFIGGRNRSTGRKLLFKQISNMKYQSNLAVNDHDQEGPSLNSGTIFTYHPRNMT